MKMDKKVTKPWRDPASGIYYTNFRVPTELVPLEGKKLIQRSLRTKDRRVAERKNCEAWLAKHREWDRLRRERSLKAPLSEEFVPHLVEEWLHCSLKADEDGRIMGDVPRTKERMGEVYYGMIDELAEGGLTGNHPEFLVRAAAVFLDEKGVAYDSRSLAFRKFVEELSPRYARYLNSLASRDEGQNVRCQW